MSSAIRPGVLRIASYYILPAIVLSGICVYILRNEVKVTNANGVYYNECCGRVFLKNDIMKNSRGVVGIHQAIMKFGLAVYPEHDPRLFPGASLVSEERIAPFIFDSTSNPKYFDVADARAKIFRFRRVGA